jgi:hypothetical protein
MGNIATEGGGAKGQKLEADKTQKQQGMLETTTSTMTQT